MTLITHVLGGVCSVALLDTFLPNFTPDKLAYITGAVVATLPDIDYSRSFVGRIFYPIARSLESSSGHRTMTHSFLFGALIALILGSLIAFIIQESYIRWIVLIFVPYCSHFILDWFTKQGAQSYWPAQVWCVIPSKRSSRISTGKKGEIIVFLLLSSLFTVSFTPSREMVSIWFRSSFITQKDHEFKRYEVKREMVTHGYSKEELLKLKDDGILSSSEYQSMIYELNQIDINESITRKMYGIPDTAKKQ
jgi:membrane-bound metal-dependent hydrolase YbcI (DUF457 family)